MRYLTLLILAINCSAMAEDFFREIHTRTDNTGYQVVISHQQKPIVNLQYGYADVEQNKAVTEDTQFLIMSITKAFTGAALVKAISAGSINPQAPASDYVAGVRALKNEDRTIALFASHLAGAPHRNHPERRALYDQHFVTALGALAGLAGKSWTRPGKYRYSSGNYMVLAAALEKATQTQFIDYVRRTLLIPLQLLNTHHQDVNDMASVARNYTLLDVWNYKPVDAPQRVPRFDYSFNQGGGSMTSTAADLVRFGEAFLKPGFFTEQELGLVHDQINQDSPWSYGWIRSPDPQGRQRLLISGSTIGAMASLMVYPDDQLVAATTVNCWCKQARQAELIVAGPERFIDQYLRSAAR